MFPREVTAETSEPIVPCSPCIAEPDSDVQDAKFPFVHRVQDMGIKIASRSATNPKKQGKW